MGFYSKTELKAFDDWCNKQRQFKQHYKMFDTVYKPWNDYSLSYSQRYQHYLNGYGFYKLSKLSISKQLNQLLFHNNGCINEIKNNVNAITDWLRKQTFIQNNDVKQFVNEPVEPVVNEPVEPVVNETVKPVVNETVEPVKSRLVNYFYDDDLDLECEVEAYFDSEGELYN